MQTARKYYALIAFVIACVAIAGILPGVYAAPLDTPVNPGNSGLISWWSLDETSGTRNDSYSTNHLSDNNTVGYTTGKKGNAADFISANTEYLSVADNAALSPNYVTVGGWVNLKTKATQNIFLKYASGDPSFAVYYDTTSDRFICLLVKSDSTSVSVTASTFGSPSTSTWYLLFCQYDGSNVSISVNAGTANTSALTGVMRDSSVPFVLGSSVNFFLNSYLDEVFMYNRSLSANEREWLYNSGTGRTYSELAPTATPTNTATKTNTPTQTNTPTITFTPSNTPTITFTPSNTPTNTATTTPTNTATATPSTCSDGGTLTSGLWTNTSGVSADTCTNNSIRMEWQEPDSGSGSSISAAFTTTSTTFYDVTFNGHYTGTHTIKLQCQDDVTPSLYHDLAVLDISLGVDETINAELPQTCNDGTPILRFYNTNAGNSVYYLKIDQLILTAQPATATPTITNTPTRTPTVTATATRTATSAATNTATETATPTITNTPTETFTPTITFTPTVTRTPMPTRTPGGPDMPLLNWNGDVSYGEFATTITVSLLCLIVLVGSAVFFTVNMLNKKKDK